MSGKLWTSDELLLAVHLYYRIPFGQQHSHNPEVLQLAKAIGRTGSSVAMRLSNFTACDPAEKARGVKGLDGGGKACKDFWDDFHRDQETMAAKAESLWITIVEKASPVMERAVGETPFTGLIEKTTNVKVRLAQGFFRRAVLASYENKCCITGIPIKELLVASHILPWATHPEKRVAPSNGLCLSRMHDTAFDRGLITFDGKYRLITSRRIKDHHTIQSVHENFLAHEGKMLSMPDKNIPDTAALEWHRQHIFQS